jgi:hypothetical protein
MAHRLSITKVRFRARAPRTKKGEEKLEPEFLELGNLDGAGATALAYFERLFAEVRWPQPLADPTPDTSPGRHAIRGIAELVPTGRSHTVAAMLLAGETGVESTVYGSDFETKAGTRTGDMIEAPRVLALAHMPPRATTGYLVTHSYHGRYFKTGLLKSLSGEARRQGLQVVIKHDTWAPTAELAQVLSAGTLVSVDLEQHVQIDDYEPFTTKSAGEMRLRLKPENEKGGAFDIEKLKQADSDESVRKKMLSVAGVKFHELAVTMRYAGSTRQFVLGAPNDEWASVDVTDHVGDAARPDPELLVAEAVKLLAAEGLLTA